MIEVAVISLLLFAAMGLSVIGVHYFHYLYLRIHDEIRWYRIKRQMRKNSLTK